MTLDQEIELYTPREPKPLAVVKRMIPKVYGDIAEKAVYAGRFTRNLLVDASSLLWVPTAMRLYNANATVRTSDSYGDATISTKQRFDVAAFSNIMGATLSTVNVIAVAAYHLGRNVIDKSFEPGFFTKYAGVFLAANAVSFAYERGRDVVNALRDKYSKTKQDMITESKAAIALPSLETDVVKVYDEFKEKGGEDEEFATYYFGDSAASGHDASIVDVDGKETISALESRLKSEKEARLQRLAQLHNERETKYAHIQKLIGVNP